MPELPEVETVVRGLRQRITGRTITGVEVYWERAIATPCPSEFAAQLVGQRIRSVDRRGKFVVMGLEGADLLVHLRMTGQLLVVPAGQAHALRHVRVALALGDLLLIFNDARKFGRMALVPDARQWLAALGPEPLDPDFTAAALAARLQRRRLPIKSLLLDQRFLAGVGNIYADEVLHAACIAPTRPASSLSAAEAEALHAALQSELQRAIANRGTTLSDYRDAEGHSGAHQHTLRVYGREGKACPRCGGAIARMRLGGRSSYHCPRCQR